MAANNTDGKLGASGKAAPLTKYQLGACEKFNSKCKLLATDLKVHYATDPKIARAHKQIMVALSDNPLFVIDSIGAYLYDYRVKIMEGDKEFFIENKYDKELKEGVVPDKIELVKYIMPKLKDKFKTLSDTEKDGYMEMVQDMLDEYMNYKLGEPKE